MSDCLEGFTKGWVKEDIGMMLNACADDFVYDDPYDGRITKAQFADYSRGLPDGELGFSDESTREAEGEQTNWFWWAWKTPGGTVWAQEGSALAKAGPDGIHSMRFVYYKRQTGFTPAAFTRCRQQVARRRHG